MGRSSGACAPVLAVLCLLLSGCAGVAHPDEPRRTPTVTVAPTALTAPAPTSAPTPAPDVFATGIEVAPPPGTWMSWALLDRAGGRSTGSPGAATERTNAESSIKAWIALDTLRLAAAAGRPVGAGERASISDAIRASDDAAAERLYRAAGGDQVLDDLEAECGVAVSTAQGGFWSYAQITAQDAVRTLDCVLDRAPSYPGGTDLVDDLHHVRPEDAFGIPAALPAGTAVAVKNGWTRHSGTGLWNVDCVASWSHYALAVLTRYPAARSLDDGAALCRDVTAAVVARLPA